MKIEKIKIGNKKVMPFTIPSGIITTQISCLEKLAKEIPELGILTTKSIGPEQREGNREPILAQYMPVGFINAVGLTNPGAEAFSKELSESDFPKEKFLLASIFGKNAGEFVYVAKTLEQFADGFELNLSCPHAKGYGMQLGQDPQVVNEITKEVTNNTSKPVFAKLTPNASNISEIAKSAVKGGAYGITAINTVGPGYHSVDGKPVLTNKVGGLSGTGIFPIGLKCVREIRQAVGGSVPIIGMGGIKSSREILEYSSAGADIFGIGSALAGMADEQLKKYFQNLVNDIEKGTDTSYKFLQQVNMRYQKATLTKILNPDCNFKIIKTNKKINAGPGQFVFAWIPGVGEKPFSVMDDNPLTLGILERGEFTKKINSLKKGDSFYVRGAYGQSVDIPEKSEVVLVGGGCGIAGLYLLAKKFSDKTNRILTLLGAKDKNHLPYLKEFEKYSDVKIVTEDGGLGEKGLVTRLFNETHIPEGGYFFNCGPKSMVEAVLPLEIKISGPERIYSSVDYMTRCGVGICGSCADEKGRRTCVEGPFMNY
jgi:dihydroorotate dehydrogenase subfamily 1